MSPRNWLMQAVRDNFTLYGRDRVGMAFLQSAAMAPVFCLADRGNALDVENPFRELRKIAQETPTACRLPFPVTAIEFAVPTDAGEIDAEREIISSRRVVVAFDIQSLAGAEQWTGWDATKQLGLCEGDTLIGVAVEFYFDDAHKDWNVDPVCHFVVIPSECERLDARSLSKLSIVPFLRKYVSYEYERRLMQERLQGGDAMAAQAVISLVAALSCSNVVKRQLPTNDRVNEKRVKRGKLPFAKYWVLDIVDRDETSHKSAVGSHQSPAQHVRRGHIRRLADGRRIWVNWCWVGKSANGVVDKDYRVVRRAA